MSVPDDIGKQIASPLISINDNILYPSNISAEAFDSEGTPTRKVSLIEKGVLSGFLHSAGTAKRMNAKLTGNANIGAKVTVSPNFYHVFAGKAAEFELFSGRTVEFEFVAGIGCALHISDISEIDFSRLNWFA